MDNKKIVKEMIDLQKESFDNCFSAMVMLQDQAVKFLRAFVDQSPGIKDEGKKVVDQWVGVYNKSRDNFKKAIDEGYSKLESLPDYNALIMFPEQAEKIFNTFLNCNKWMPQDFNKNMDEMITMYRNGYKEFNKHLSESKRYFEDFLSAAGKSDTKNE